MTKLLPDERFWIVMRLDKPGPVEAGKIAAGYVRHPSFLDADREARRLMTEHGGFWAVLHPCWIVGTIDYRVRPVEDDYIPF